MKRILFYLMVASAAAVACNKVSPEVDSDLQADILTVNAGLTDTKVAVDNGKLTWTDGDAIAVYNTEGAKFVLTLSEGAGTKSGKFSGSFSGTLATDVAVYPAGLAGEVKGVVSIPKFMERSDLVQPVMASALEVSGSEVNAVGFHHVMALVELTLKDIPAYACALKLFSKTGAQLNGDYTINAQLDGVECATGSSEAGTNDRILYFPYKTAYGAGESVEFYFPVAPYEYTDLKIRVLDGDEDIIEGTDLMIKTTSSNLKAGDYLAMPAVNVRAQVGKARDQYVKVEGVKWAKGNLRAWKSGTSGEGWQNGWNIYDHQWESQYMLLNDAVDGASVNFSLNNANYKEENVYTHWDYFSWGTIGRASRVHNQQIISSVANFEICSKVFSAEPSTSQATDVSQCQELTGDARFANDGEFDTNPLMAGDLAFWASKGQYRMPMKDELKKLYAKNVAGEGSNVANMQAGFYMVGDKKINGILFTSCPSWSTTAYVTEAIELTDADLESGLFLPKIGERTKNDSKTAPTFDATGVKFFNAWGAYWSGTSGGMNAGFEQCAVHIYFTTANAMNYGYTGTASQTMTGHTKVGNAIRPVFIPENERQ